MGRALSSRLRRNRPQPSNPNWCKIAISATWTTRIYEKRGEFSQLFHNLL